MTKLEKEIGDHYLNQLLKQIHVVVLGLDVLGNPFGVARGVAEGVESFFYEPYKVRPFSRTKNEIFDLKYFTGAMEGPIEFLEGIATGTKNLVGSVVDGAAGALSKVTQATSKGLATLTLDHSYQNARIQRKEIQSQTTPEILASGKNAVKDIVEGVKGVVTKPIKGAKRSGAKGLFKGLGKSFLGLVGRPASEVADLTSTSFKLIRRVATDEQIIHRIRNPRHIGRDGLVRPSIAHETLGNFIFDKFGQEHHTDHEGYVGHIDSSVDPPSLFFATTKSDTIK
jgi:vacuolar protein sorting-associated protein 13A/C